MSDAILVSVIIATRNEAKNIEQCLKSLQNQTFFAEKMEIIIVDKNSTDNTQEIAKKFPVSLLTEEKNRAAQVNVGVNAAKGKYIFLPDADMRFEKNLIENCVKLFETTDLVGVYIPEIVLGPGIFGKVRNFERSFYNATCIDAVRFVRTDAFNRIAGFDENILFGPDDWDFDRRMNEIGKSVLLKTSYLCHDEHEMTFLKYLNKKEKYLHTFDSYIKKWGEKDLIIKKQFGFYYRMYGVFVERGKWKKLIKNPIIAGSMFFFKLTVGMIYLTKRFLPEKHAS